MAAKLFVSRLISPSISRCRTFAVGSVAPAKEEPVEESTKPPPAATREEKQPKLSDKEIFENLLRDSKLVSSGSFLVGQTVLGQVVAVTNDNIYVDFGGKFHGVVPQTKDTIAKAFRKGTMVDIRVKDLEVTTHFLGTPRDSSLLEADIELATLKFNRTETPRVDY